MPYQYQPLPYLQSIRLVQIVPRAEGTAKSSPVHLKLRTVHLSLETIISPYDHGERQMRSSVSFDEYVTTAPEKERFKVLYTERDPHEFDLVADIDSTQVEEPVDGEDSTEVEEPLDDDDIIAGMTGVAGSMLPQLLASLRMGQEIRIRANNMNGPMFAPDGAKVQAAGRKARPVIARPAGESPYKDRFDWEDGNGPFSGNYVALSYCWGSEADKPEIFIDGQSVWVTKNLDLALRRFRELDIFKQGLWMWIDALSINQDDLEETLKQIKMMNQIYALAGNVVVWLGDTDGPEQETMVKQSMAMLQDISRHYRTEYEGILDDAGAWESCAHRHRATLQLEASRRIWANGIGFGATFLKNCQESELVAIHDLFNQDYWRRLWVIQELAASQSSAPIFFGECVTQWRFVRDASYLLLDIEEQFREMVSAALQRRGTPMRLDYSVRHVTVIGDLARLGRLQPEHFDNSVPLPITHNVGTNSANVVAQVLRAGLALACGAGCKKPQDRVYGLLNLAAMPWASISITPDQPASKVFIEFARACIKQDLTLSILSLLDGADGAGHDLPSWCPDFARGADRAIRPLEGRWSANGDECDDELQSLLRGIVEFEEDEPMTLSSMAWIVDTVDALGGVSALDQAHHTFDEGFVSDVVQPTPPEKPSSELIYNAFVAAGFIPDERDNEGFEGEEAALAAFYEANKAEVPSDDVQTSTSSRASTDNATKKIIYETLVAGATIGGVMAHETFQHLLSAFTEHRPPPGSPDISNWEFVQASKSLEVKGEPLGAYFTFSTDPIDETERRDSAKARQTMEACTRNRRLIVTETGRLGLAPVRVQKGDKVVIMNSHTVPLIVRPIHEFGEGYVERGLIGRIIGEAYVSGIMYGEIVDEDWEESGFAARAQLQHCYFV